MGRVQRVTIKCHTPIKLHFKFRPFQPTPLKLRIRGFRTLRQLTRNDIRWDDWVPQDRLRKFTDENRTLAKTLVAEMQAMQRSRNQGSKSSKKKNEGSARASEERHSSVAASGQMRGYKRNLQQMEIEDVSH
jgi:hypothetical protein